MYSTLVVTSKTTTRRASIPEDQKLPLTDRVSATIAMAAQEGIAALDPAGTLALTCDRASPSRQRFAILIGGTATSPLSAREAYEQLQALSSAVV